MRRAPGKVGRRVVRRRAAPHKVVPVSDPTARGAVARGSVRAVREVVVPAGIPVVREVVARGSVRAAVAGRTRRATIEAAEVAGMTVSATGVRPMVTSAR